MRTGQGHPGTPQKRMGQGTVGEALSDGGRQSLWRFLTPATIFLAALLLFEVEPLIAKMILPWFGGSAAVWMACLLFFQTALLAGYLYAHLLSTRLSVRWQWRVHVLLLVVSLASLPIIPAMHWKPAGSENPLMLILGLLSATIGLPFLLLSSTTPLLTAWTTLQGSASQSLTRLYALSNLGSMLALISYPVLIEPLIATHGQALIWSGLYVGFVVLGITATWRLRSGQSGNVLPESGNGSAPLLADRIFWFLLPMMASALLLAVTNHILRNIAAIPLLWVVPLALYLLSFVICFDSPRWYVRLFWYPWFAVFSGAIIYVMVGLFLLQHFLAQLAFFAAGFLVCCVVCHGELAALKPAPRHLSAYYLTIAAGGAAGGLFVAVIAPLAFRGDIDLALILPLTVLLIIRVAFRRWPLSPDSPLSALVLAAVLVAWLLDTGRLVKMERDDFASARFVERNFYGALRVEDLGAVRVLQNGNVVHGREFLAPDRAAEPTSYYGRQSGLGLALAALGENGPIKVGVIGLGAGTIAAYGRAGDSYIFYEINPAVRDIATSWFRFLSLSPAKKHIVLGDARLSLERQAPQKFDLLAVDAFTSDSIPIHLLTHEGFAQYWRHLKPGGVLAVHVSNLYIDLAPVVALAAREDGKTARMVTDPGDDKKAQDLSDWILVTANPSFFQHPALAKAAAVAIPEPVKLWTDDYSNLWRSLR
ncbi:MAG TPA: fused MFS/spermidine synthase [Rhizomicrobium sp.]|nr:fused MFS/spermidine synthase [Rhizomicrobium sp.]